MSSGPDIRSLALIGARVRRDELRAQLAEVENTIKALQQVTKAAPLKKRAKAKAAAKKKRAKYNDKFKAEVVATAKTKGVSKTAEEYGIHPNQIYKWRKA